MKQYKKILSGALAAAMLFAAVPRANAASSAEIQQQIDALEQEHSAIAEQLDALQQKENANWSSTEEMVAQKNNIDEQIFLLYSQLDNLDEQIMEYRQLIAENQKKLDDAQARLDELSEKSKVRIRAMEEGGRVSYWSVVFKANSFIDLIDRLNMVHEIAQADKRMLDELNQAVAQVEAAQQELVGQKAVLEQSRAEQLQAQEALDEKRAEADKMLGALNQERLSLEEDHKAIEDQKNAMLAEIAQSEVALNEARAREEAEEERRRQEEEEKRRQEEEANKPKPEPDDTEDSEDDSSEDDYTPPASNDSGWLQPCDYVYVSSPYGWRDSGWHNGVDFAAYRGNPVYATRSGTVTKAVSINYSYGNHVVINHGDGFSSLYAHMDYFVVSEGEYVSQGEVIGYVGSTGNSTGPHLHFTILYNGSDVNPFDYL